MISAKQLDLFLISVVLLQSSAAAQVSFNRDIRPIMSDTCFRCHGPDKSARMAGMRLDIREEALKPTESGKLPIVPGKPEESEIIQRIFSSDSTQIMPPEFSHKTLTQPERETIRQWVAEGAKYEGHWSFQSVKRPLVPELTDSQAPQNPIDVFIQARLAKEGLKPSPEADRRTLIRRVALDLTGIPPTPAEVSAFVHDSSVDAYEKLVDKLLASPRYAEQQTLHWLDAVRYADTRGFHNDIPQPAWPYRDYVLRAFRDNKAFDLFAREQMAGDLLPNATLEQKVASAYNRILRTSEEGGIQDKEYLAKYGADRVRTTGSVWLGLTLGCSECHDHKFDPIKAKDFYAMKAFFADIKESGILPGSGLQAWAATLSLPTEEQTRQLVQLNADVTAAERALAQRTHDLAGVQSKWEQRLLAEAKMGQLKWHYQRPFSAKSTNGTQLRIYNDEAVDSNLYVIARNGSWEMHRGPGNGLTIASGPNPDNETYTISFKPGAGTWTALGVQAVQDESLPAVRLSRGADRFVLSEVEAEVSSDERVPATKVSFALATTNGFGEAPENPPMAAIDRNPATGWGVSSGDGRSPFLALRFGEPVKTTNSSVMTVHLRHDTALRRATIGRVRLALSAGRYSWPELGDAAVDLGLEVDATRFPKGGVRDGIPAVVLEALTAPSSSPLETQIKSLEEHFQWSEPELQPLFVQLQRVNAARSIHEAGISKVLVTEAVEPRETRVLSRGNWMDDSGEIVQPAIPAFLGHLQTSGVRATRLDLANWVVSQENPLTARVFVNRQWRQLFGIGLAKTLDDLGSQGEWPTHPELLDWLAAEFMRPAWQAQGAHSWDVKHILRTIVTSHTYRQSSLSNPQLDERDPDNRLLARQSRFRVNAEVVHDVALAVSGLLAEKFGGPSVRPYQPDGYLAAMNFPKRDYSAGRGQDLYRRGVYTFWQRTFLHPSLLTFDAPSREECTVNRVNSNTPLQALAVLNDPIFVEASRVFAQNILRNGGSAFDSRIDWAFSQAVSRKPTADERAILANLHDKGLRQFKADPQSAHEFIQAGESPIDKTLKPIDLAAMMTVARVILNLHETITRN